MTSIKHLIHGEHVADDARTTDVFNPSTGQAIHKLGLASRATVQKAIESAQAAFPAWRNTPPAKRAQVMFRFKQLLEANELRIAKLISEEHGKTIEDAVGELKRGIDNVEFASAAPELLKGDTVATSVQISMPGVIYSQSALSPALPLSTSRPWCHCGCTRLLSPAAIASFSNRQSVTRAPRC